jgi:outer membrane protein OmpA-like peptidoglycan-associated protein
MSTGTRAITTVALVLAVAGCQAATDTLSRIQISGAGGVGQAANVAGKALQAAPTIKGAFSDMDEPQEIELGRAVSAAVGKHYRLLRDRELTRYVALVGNAVAAHSERPDLRYYFGVLDAPDVNAFAAPGGFIFITKGALGVMKDEATLAGVLGHEVAHIARRHAVETIKAQKRTDLVMLIGREATAQSSLAAFSGAISLAADAVADQVILKGFSRAEEAEADRLGFTYAAAAGYDPAGLHDFLAALVDRGGRDSAIAKFLSTHPGTPERLKVQEDLLKSRAAGGRRNPERFLRAAQSRPAIAAVPPPAPPPAPPAQRPTSEFLRSLHSSGRYVSYGIQFDPGSDRLKPESGATLKMIADALQGDPSMRLQIEGHTDATGHAAMNVELSRRRAEAVKAALVSRFGIPTERLTTSGVGAARPLDTNDTPAGRAANRRVEFVRQ